MLKAAKADGVNEGVSQKPCIFIIYCYIAESSRLIILKFNLFNFMIFEPDILINAECIYITDLLINFWEI